MLRQQDVGHRIVVRRIVVVSDDRPLFSDALGELVQLTETDLTLNTATGALRIPLHEVHRAKRVPPARRPRAGDVIHLELAANAAWPAPVQARLGSWVLRAAGNWTGRANSALAVGDPDRPLEAAIDTVERWYAEQGQQPLINAPMPLAAPVNAALDARGWTARPLTLVQTAPLGALLPPGQPDAPPDAASRDADRGTTSRDADRGTASDLPPVRLRPAPSDAWLAMVAEHKGALPEPAVRVLTGVPLVCFAHVSDAAGGLVAVARGTVTMGWLGVALVQVAPGTRRHGLGRHVVRALAGWAREHGADRAFLQVEERNSAAVALYAGLGFRTHHTYLTREAPLTRETPLTREAPFTREAPASG